MTNLLPDAHTTSRERTASPMKAVGYSASRKVVQVCAVIIVLAIYSYPSLRARAHFGPSPLPPEFAPDLSLYLNLGSVQTVQAGQVLNPYYLVPVPAQGTAYLKIRFGPALFSNWSRLLGGRMWLAMFLWNLFWCALLCAITLWLFERLLPISSWGTAVAGLGLLMLINTPMAKLLLTAWAHLPSLSGFQSATLPFLRAFTPQIPIPLLLAYLGLQMGALRGKGVNRWIGMGVLQLLALSTFPYATLIMAGLTFVSVTWQLFSRRASGIWQIPLAYGLGCAMADGAFLMRGSMNIYASHSSLIHFQPHVLPHLIGGAWFLLCLLTLATVLARTLPSEVKWPLVGLGVTTALLMLGDAVVPSTVLLLSMHAGYFAHCSIAVLFTFLVAAALARTRSNSIKAGIAFGVVLTILALNGLLLSLGAYNASLPGNLQQVRVAHLLSSWRPMEGDLLIARSLNVDDDCGWITLLSKGPVLFCTDAETMLTPQQNRDIHRFRQAVYLYMSGKGSGSLQRALAAPDPSMQIWQLGYWAEALGTSEERNEGIHAIQSDLIPLLEQVERHDAAVDAFFHQYRRIIVIDNQRDRAFAPDRLASYLRLEGQQTNDDLVLLSYASK